MSPISWLKVSANTAVARRLFLSPATVANHVSRILRSSASRPCGDRCLGYATEAARADQRAAGLIAAVTSAKAIASRARRHKPGLRNGSGNSAG